MINEILAKSNSQISTLLDIPSDVLRLILQKTDYITQVILRSVCRRTRHLTPHYVQIARGLSEHVAGDGQLALLKWAQSQGCFWNVWTCAAAAQGGHLEVLQWARANGCHWNASTC